MDAIWRRLQKHKRLLLILSVVILAVYVIVPQLGGFHNSWHHIYEAHRGWLLSAVAFTFLTYLAAAGTYALLAFKKLPYPELVLVQLAAMCVNKLLPGGVGALGANFAYLRHRGHSATQAGIVAAVNNMLGFAGHISLLVVVFIFSSQPTIHFKGRGFQLVLGIALVAFACALAAYLLLGKRLEKTIKEVKQQLGHYRSKPAKLGFALSTSIALTLFNCLCLSACLNALGVHISLFSCLVVLSFGVGIGTATPTPGGVGGFEAGLVSSLLVYKVSPASALAAALLYRLVSYWLPLIIGIIALIACQRRKLFSF